MDQLTYTRLSLLSCAVVFYYYYHKLLSWYLDQVPLVPKLTELFEEIIELDTSQYMVIHPSEDDEEIIEIPRHPIIEPNGMVMGGMPFPIGMPFPMGAATIVIEGPVPLLQLERMLGAAF